MEGNMMDQRDYRCRFIAIIIIVTALVTVSATSAAVDDPEELYQEIRASYRQFKDDKKRHEYRHHYLNRARSFERFIKKFPNNAHVPEALFSIGKLYQNLYRVSRLAEDLDQSLVSFRRLVKEYPRHRLADDAQLNIALVFVEFRKDPARAKTELKYLLKNFPKGDMVPKARQMLEDLGEDSAESEGPPPKTAREGVEPEEHKPIAPKLPEKTPPEKEHVKVPPEPPAEPSQAPEKSVLEEIRHWTDPGYSRLVLYTRTPAQFRVGALPPDAAANQPARLYVDLLNTELSPDLNQDVVAGDGIVKRVRCAVRDEGAVRVVIDLDQEREQRVIPMDDPARVVVDIGVSDNQHTKVLGKPQAKEPEAKQPEPSAVTSLHVPKSSPGRSLSMLAGLKVKRVVIDPGHGGSDPGAIGPSGVLEKDITLDIGKQLAKLLREDLKLEVNLTRDSDTFVALEERTAFANTKKADLFISIHLNAARNRDLRGIQTFYLDITDDTVSLHLAARENSTSEKSISQLQLILADLALKSHVDDSIALGQQIQRATVGSLKRNYDHINDLGLKYALFYVLMGARMPAVLVEASFISNPEDEKRLRNKNYRKAVVEAIYVGIKNFIVERNKAIESEGG
jgi:N-acetylmuramoyl-L-alanine amidase